MSDGSCSKRNPISIRSDGARAREAVCDAVRWMQGWQRQRAICARWIVAIVSCAIAVRVRRDRRDESAFGLPGLSVRDTAFVRSRSRT